MSESIEYQYKGKSNSFFTKGNTYSVRPYGDGKATKDNNGDDKHTLSNGYLSKNFFTVYTQEMNDNGILPSVGMEFIDSASYSKAVRACLFVDGDKVVYRVGDEYSSATLEECEPLAPLVKLIDGKAYQLTGGAGGVFYGIYNKDRNIFSVQQGQHFDLARVTNIKPLTVEVK